MDFVHCNRCQEVPSNDNRSFWFTSCSHIYCKKCVQKLRVVPSNGVMCVHCKKQCQVVEIGPNMPPKVKKLFTPLATVLKEQAAILKRVCKFQADQLDSLMGFARKEKEMLKKAMKAYQQGSGQVNALAKNKAELQGQIAYHKKRLEEFDRNIKIMQQEMKDSQRPARPVGTAPATGYPSVSHGLNFMNLSSQSDAASFRVDLSKSSSMKSTLDSSFSFLAGCSEQSTPQCSQLSTGQLTTPKMLGVPKRGGGVRSDNPYAARWNQASADRQKKANSKGSSRAKSKSRGADISNESPMAWKGKGLTGEKPMGWKGKGCSSENPMTRKGKGLANDSPMAWQGRGLSNDSPMAWQGKALSSTSNGSKR